MPLKLYFHATRSNAMVCEMQLCCGIVDGACIVDGGLSIATVHGHCSPIPCALAYMQFCSTIGNPVSRCECSL